MSKTCIEPKKPILYKDFHISIKLTKNQVDLVDIAIIARRQGFREQTDRHITILSDIAGEQIENAISKLSAGRTKIIKNKIKSLVEDTDWKFKPQKIFYLTKETKDDDGNILEKRESFIRVVDMPGMGIFYKKLNKLLGTRIPVQFPHITLFSKGELPNCKYYGIPVNSKNEFRKLKTREISEESNSK